MPIPPPEITYVTGPRVVCDGATAANPELGHPRVYMAIDEKGYVECGYCDRRFVLKGGPADLPPPASPETNQTVTG